MANFDDHIQQVNSNLSFLKEVNSHINAYYDWQLTVCFYTALHLVNAHLSKHQLQYRKHHDVNYALNPFVQLSLTKLSEDAYDAYMALQRLSRRSRYLVNEKDDNIANPQAFFTYDKHLCKAIRNLDRLMKFFSEKYSLPLTTISFKCIGLNQHEGLRFFQPFS